MDSRSLLLNHFQNTFSQVLFKFGFNFFKMLTVDLLHDFKLGPCKDLFAHIVRILEFLGPDKVQTFDERCVLHEPLITRYFRPDHRAC